MCNVTTSGIILCAVALGYRIDFVIIMITKQQQQKQLQSCMLGVNQNLHQRALFILQQASFGRFSQQIPFSLCNWNLSAPI